MEKMMKRKILILYMLLVFLVGFFGMFLALQRMPTQTHASGGSTDWTMFQGNLEHSGFNGSETILNPTTAPQMKVVWTRHVGGRVTSQVVEANGLLYWGSWDGFEHASNPSTGTDVWATNVGTTTPGPGCSPSSGGPAGAASVTSVPINGTMTEVAFVSGGNATLYALNAGTGAILWRTLLGSSPSHMVWAGPVVYQGSVYVGVSSLGDCPLVQGQLVQLNASTGAVQHTFNAVPNGCIGAGIWDTPTIDQATGILYVSTGTYSSCGYSGNLAMGLLALRTTDLSLVSSWLLPLAQGPGDSDFGSTPTLFQATIGGTVHQMVGLVNKNGVYYAFDRANLSAGPLWQFQVSFGIRGGGGNNFSSSGWDGSRLYVAGGGTAINGTKCSGSLRAFDPATGKPTWEACLGGAVVSSVMAVPGLVVVGAGTQEVAVDAATGKQIFTFNDTSAGSFFAGTATIVNGNLYVGNEDGSLFAFGVSGTSTPTPPPGISNVPVSKLWYFAEGYVGGSFSEFLTLENPDTQQTAQVQVEYLFTGGTAQTFVHTVPPQSRVTIGVNDDLRTPANGTGRSVSMIVTSLNGVGIVAERPMYFDFFGIRSGTDVLGATQLAQDFYFADVESQPNYSSFITILNPPGGKDAHVTLNYYAGGAQIGTQTIVVPAGQRGTTSPAQLGINRTSALHVHSDQPVVVERPTYFSTSRSNISGPVTGAFCVVGTQAVGKDWLFAEGYTGSNFHEYLSLANFNSSVTANATVKLEYTNGMTHTTTLTIAPQSQAFVDVNSLSSGFSQATPEVSAEVTSDMPIVAQRQEYFRFGGTLPGGTDAVGQPGPAKSAYSFAEGYTGQGFSEFLTLQNPNTTSQDVVVGLYFANTITSEKVVTVPPQTRMTLDINALAMPIVKAVPQAGYSVSIAVQAVNGTIVVERPMYFNFFNVDPGGSDVVGYSG